MTKNEAKAAKIAADALAAKIAQEAENAPQEVENAEEVKADEAPPALSLEERLMAMVTAAVTKAAPTKKVASKVEKTKAPLIGAPSREVFELPSPEAVKALGAMDRMNLLLDAAEVLGFGEDLVGILEKNLQNHIGKALDVVWVCGVVVPMQVVRYWTFVEFDQKALAATGDKVKVETEVAAALKAVAENKAKAAAEAEKLEVIRKDMENRHAMQS